MSAIAVLGIPYDEKASFMRGAAEAPSLIRKEFYSNAYNLTAESGTNLQSYDLTDLGDAAIAHYFDIEQSAYNHLQKGYRLFSIGGDHSITYPLIKAYARRFGPVQILHLDAHPDLYDQFSGDPYSHACPFARIMEDQLATRLVQVGIRAQNAHQNEQAKRFGVEQIFMRDFHNTSLPEFEQAIYLSLDLDVIDPAFAPGVSHQEAGGLSSREVINIIQTIQKPIIGADLVEYNPKRDHSNITAALAAKLMKEILSKMIDNQ